MEPLAAVIRLHLLILGQHVGSITYKLGLYADNVIVVMTNPLQSSPALYDILMHFGHLSLYKDNCSKSCLNQITKINLYTLVSFPMGPMLNVTYLHLQLAVPFSNTLRINYEALLKKLQDLCSSLRST